MKTEIKHLRFIHQYGRQVAVGQLYDKDDALLLEGTLSQILSRVEEEGYQVINAQELLDTLVRKIGFAA